ncbi:MAG: site-specific integrase [Nanoarchaeota archaeon]|nr:site-specific integrase [Nanoarchaeota archaeon]
MELRQLYPNRETNYYKCLKTIQESDKISPRNKELLKEFGNSLISKGTTGKYTVGKRWGQILTMLEWLQKDFDKATISDLQGVIVQLQNTNKSNATKSDYRRSLKQFYSWLEDHDERLLSNDFLVRETTKKIYKFLRKDVSLYYKKDKIDPEQVITEEDLQCMLEKGCETTQEKALLALFHEIGARFGEVATIQIKHFKVNDRGIGEVFLPTSKTEQRVIDIVDSVPLMLEHRATHPCKNNKDFPLFYYVKKVKGRKTRIEHFTHQRLYQLFQKIAERAEITKKHNPHWFRHSRASLDSSSTLPVDIRCKRMGWIIGSKMQRNYTHISDKQVREAWLKEKGIKFEEEEKPKQIKCICQRFISSSYNHCPFCGRPTSTKVYEQEKLDAEELLKQKDELMSLIPSYTNPEQQQQFIETLKYISEIAKNPKLLSEFKEMRSKSS